MENMNYNTIYPIDKSPYGSHMKIVALVGSNKHVLDIGSGGYLGEEFVKNGCKVVSIEKDPKSAGLANRYSEKVIVTNVEQIDDLEYHNYFDVIVYADILEHLKDPQKVLEKFRPVLKESGYIIVSLPNIAQLWVRLSLLCGKFNYSDHGILDKTHLRFFTLKTSKDLLKTTGFLIESIDYTVHPFWPIFIRPAIYCVTQLFPSLFAVQFIFKLKKIKNNINY